MSEEKIKLSPSSMILTLLNICGLATFIFDLVLGLDVTPLSIAIIYIYNAANCFYKNAALSMWMYGSSSIGR